MKVAVIRSWYLPMSETFIYSELVNLRDHEVIVCTRRLMNLDQFPFEHIFQFHSLKELREILQKEKVDLIHARFGLTAAEILDVKRRLKIPMVTSFHGFDLPSNRRSFKKYNGRLKALFNEGELFTATSKNMKKILLQHGCPERKLFVHRSGIELTRFHFQERKLPNHGDVILLTVGRLVEKKGMRDLIDGFARVIKKYPSIQLRIVGDGPLRNALKKQVRSLHLKGKVTFLGELSHEQVMKEMEQAHLFALASAKDKSGNQEGIPNVLKEAMACGLPVVSTKHAGIPELVRDGKSGYLVKEHSPKELAKSILKLVDSPDKWGDMGKQGRKMIEKSYDATKQVRELEDIYGQVYFGHR